jgi:hypothetical protein
MLPPCEIRGYNNFILSSSQQTLELKPRYSDETVDCAGASVARATPSARRLTISVRAITVVVFGDPRSGVDVLEGNSAARVPELHLEKIMDIVALHSSDGLLTD